VALHDECAVIDGELLIRERRVGPFNLRHQLRRQWVAVQVDDSLARGPVAFGGFRHRAIVEHVMEGAVRLQLQHGADLHLLGLIGASEVGRTLGCQQRCGEPGGLAGAVWSDANNDGTVDGYTYNGNYYAGTPSGYDNTLGRVATGAAVGGALGAGAGALIPGVSVLEGAIAGAVVGGLAGAIWSDQNNDGRVDGYMYNGQYYAGTPQTNPPTTTAPPPPMGAGERG